MRWKRISKYFFSTYLLPDHTSSFKSPMSCSLVALLHHVPSLSPLVHRRLAQMHVYYTLYNTNIYIFTSPNSTFLYLNRRYTAGTYCSAVVTAASPAGTLPTIASPVGSPPTIALQSVFRRDSLSLAEFRRDSLLAEFRRSFQPSSARCLTIASPVGTSATTALQSIFRRELLFPAVAPL